jgi:hypothetical protein
MGGGASAVISSLLFVANATYPHHFYCTVVINERMHGSRYELSGRFVAWLFG